MNDKICYICGSSKFVDDHHIDCCEGKLSPETSPLCRRCHRTYHDLGVEWFEDKYLDKVIEIENKKREIIYDSLENPVMPLQLLRKEDIRHSDYFNKIHGISPSPSKERGKKKPSKEITFKMPNNPPLCGEDWLKTHLTDYTPEDIKSLTIEISRDDKQLASISMADKKGTVKAAVKK